MAGSGRRRWSRWILDLPNEDLRKTLLVTIAVCLVCSVLVSAVAVSLRPLQEAHRERERKQYIMAILAAVPGISDLVSGTDVLDLEARVIELATGAYADAIDTQAYDQRRAASDPARSTELPADRDVAFIGRRADYSTVYVLRDQGHIRLLILPVHGSGYASTLYGYLALEGDGNTIRALTFYEHGETPGLGAQVTDPGWRGQWQGKRARDEAGRIRVRVASGKVDPAAADAAYEVDAISGATMTSQGVSDLLRFWLGEDGFGPFLERLGRERG
jgi:Na+-transporting NADH:ubiquinone oxidoreductase subunit C